MTLRNRSTRRSGICLTQTPFRAQESGNGLTYGKAAESSLRWVAGEMFDSIALDDLAAGDRHEGRDDVVQIDVFT
ncbi:hypothetical protein Pan216_26760 [Planctomycetes bacterium Pan216]|uniref:Uncharacterized protein n=1 Tax=Kolteria novifilia TaxID=2527975 RepID=A0A518B4A1_9BACT|nr:hypothetical protein Pan216_26760 [Planctomycetes bacterium Pan216]